MRLVLLTKSKKYWNYCVSGKTLPDNNWVRLISENDDIHNAILKADFTYKNDTDREINILDVFDIDAEKPYKYDATQPENYVVKRYKFKKVGHYNKSLDLITDQTNKIFFNTENRVSNRELISNKYVYSLILLKIPFAKVYFDEKNKVRANIKYNGEWYNRFPVTDEEFIRKYNNIIRLAGCDGHNFHNVHMVISLGEQYGEYHYKLIAAVFV